MPRALATGLVLTLLAAIAGLALFLGQPSETRTGPELMPGAKTVRVAGLDVRYKDEGPKDAPPILMLHGFLFSLESFDAVAKDLSVDHRVIRYDLRGHGLTGPDPSKRYTPEERAEHIGLVLDALGLSSAAIMGNSLGGLAAWRFAAANPGRADQLVLVAPGAYPMNGVGEEPAPVPAAMQAFLRFLPSAGIDATLGTIWADPDKLSDARRDEVAAMMRRDGNRQAALESIRMFTLPDPDPILAAIRAPTLIIWGDSDRVIDPSHGQKMARAIPGAALLTMPNVGHVPHEEDPEAVAKAVRSFLAAGDD